MGSRRSQKFSIDDAFEEEQNDVIRVYGATTTEKSPLKPKSNECDQSATQSSDISVRIHDTNAPFNVRPIIKGLSKLKSGDDTVSKDSDSLITEGQESNFDYDPSMPWWNHPKVRENWKMVLAAFFLLLFGMGLAVAGVIIILLPVNGLQGAVFFIAGIICFIPGAYHVIYIYLAVKGKRGYNFYHLPLFN